MPNFDLSDRRAKIATDYILSHIKNDNRVYYRGYGESIPVNTCICEGDIKSDCTEEQFQMNRRTEFIILKK